MRANLLAPRQATSFWRALAVLLLALLISSCTRKRGDESEQELAPGPVQLDLWAGVPPLEPEPDDIAAKLVPKPGPQKPEQVGEEIELPFPPPISAAPSSSEAVTGPLEVLRYGPEGAQTLVEAIRVSFNHPMVPLSSIEQLRQHPAPLQIEPAVAGEFRWLGTRTLAFYPSGRLPYSTKYKLRIPAGTKSIDGTELDKTVSWTISTPKLALERSMPADNLHAHVRLEQPIVLRFNQPIDGNKVAAALTLRGEGQRIELERVPAERWKDPDLAPWIDSWVSGGEQEWERARVLVLQPKTRLAPNTRYKLELPPGVYGEGPERSDTISVSFQTYPPLRLTPRQCSDGPCSASYGLVINANNQIRDARVIEKVHVTPAVEDMEVDASWGGITISGKFIGETTYEVTVDAGLEDVYGQRLAKPFKTKIKLGPLEPALQVWPRQQNPGIIEAQAGHTIKLQVAGLRQLEIFGTSFNSAELSGYHQARYHWHDDEWPSAMPKPVATKVLDVSGSRKRAQIIELDVDEFIEGTDNFVYLFVRSEKYKRWDWEQRSKLTQVVQLTKLGVTAAIDRDDGVVLVTDLASGEPVPGAELRILADQGAREVWKGNAGADGIARPKLGATRLSSPILVARKGDDEVFMPLDQSDLEGRWVSGLFGEPHKDEVRAFMFTERQPYKPGETVHLVGVLRRESKGPQGGVELWGAGVEAKYVVTSPRGVKVQEGSVRIGPLGTFAVDIETDEAGDTGVYRFQLTHDPLFGSRRYFGHSFSVEAFRTPEFEVEVARQDSTPLYFGDELEVEIRGRYLFGAPMVGAEASYSLSRQATDFRPPAEGLGDFHFAATPGRRWGWLGGYWGGAWNPSQHIENKTLVLDRNGVLKISHPLAQVEPNKPSLDPEPLPSTEPAQEQEPLPQAATFSIEATVVDENRQAIAGRGSFVVHPSAYYVGLRSERAVLSENERTRVEAVVVDVEGKRVAGVDVALKAVRKQTTRKPVNKDGVWVFEHETKEIETSSCQLRSESSPVACEIVVGKAGTHELIATVRDEQGRENRSALEVFVHGKDAVVWDADRKRVDLVPDKADYQPGEKAKILVRSPFDEARGFLLIEREGRAQTHELHVQGGVAVVEVEITPEMIPGVIASAVLSKPRTKVAGAPDDQDLGAPAAASGQVPITVAKELKTIVVDVKPAAEKIEPGGKLRVDLHTHTVDGAAIPAAVALFVVDEGVLNLMGYQTPDPLEFFHRRRPGEVGLFADHPMVMPRNLAEQPTAEPPVPPTEMSADIPEGALGLIGTGRGGGGEGDGAIGIGNVGSTGYGSGSGAGYGAAPAMQAKRAEAKEEAEAARAGPPAARFAAAPADAALGGIDANLAMAQEVKLRTLFATTAYFESELRTDADGRTSVEIEMPENLTSYRIMAVAVDPEQADRFGSGEASVRVRKTIMLRPSLPRFLNMGDEFEASLMVDNQSESTQTVLVGTRGLNVMMLAGETEKTIEIAPGESRELRFEMAAHKVGTMRLQFAALANEGRDATELTIPVQAPATKQAFADYGMTSASVTRALELPSDALPGFGGLEVSMSSTALNGLEDAVEFLVTYRYECSEQIASRLIPIFALGEILDDFPIAEVHERARRDALARNGIARLLERQNPDGGFRFWSEHSRESWPYVSTWVTFALLEGKRAGYAVDQAKLERALDYLDRYVRYGMKTRWGVYYDWTTRAFALWLLAGEKRGAELFDQVWAERKYMPLYARVLLMSAAHRYGRKAPVDAVLAELRDLVVESAKSIHFAESRSEAAAAEGLSVLMHSNTQTDAIVLLALLELGERGGETGDDGMVPKIMAGIMADRDPKLGGRWKSTHANAWALLAASRYYAIMEAETPDFSARIWLDELYAGEQAFTGRDMVKVNQQIPMAELLEQGVGRITLSKDGPGKLYYRLGLRYAPADFRMEAVDRGYTVGRIYEALPNPGQDKPDPDAVKQLDDGSWEIKAGTNVKVTITLVAQDRSSYVIVDDPLPAGFEGQNPRFLTSVAATSQASADYGYGEWARPRFGYGTLGHGWWYPWFSFDHTQMRDDRMLLFADWLSAGVYTYSYTARATNIGTYVLPPVHAEAMYEPERFGHGASSVVKIVE